jgi:hypothetical protein
MNNRNYQNNQFLHMPSGWGDYANKQILEDHLDFTRVAYEQLLHDIYAPETPACLNNGRVYFGMDQAVSELHIIVLENIVAWHQFYEQKLYGEINE